VRVATKYVNITRRHFAAKGIQTDIIKLYGSMGCADRGLSDRIVDLVETGNTLKPTAGRDRAAGRHQRLAGGIRPP